MKHSLAKVALILLLGVIIGGVFSEVIGLFLNPGSVAHEVLVRSRDFGMAISPNLVVLEIALEVTIHVNLMSVVGVFVASQLLRWYRF